ncbi:MAG TPA: tRNA preQ1(34) S-adenosylmethionine ribosyltransferase-isomerase QueA [Gemmatimonadales bacterium]|nr:tRNA preQ1(34) S-adenosylmethionine ribosyltransferase-isomerase QueA [Gemmatimonadales bacterium]
MTAERPLRTSDFDYDLPPELIAQVPSAQRGESRLLVVAGRRTGGQAAGGLRDAMFRDLAGLIPPGDLLVLNTTRVRHARFLGTRPSGAPAEVLLIHPATGEDWVALGKPGSAMKPGKRIRVGPDAEIETVEMLEDGNRVVRFVGLDAATAITRYGRLPLPPYITRDPDASDEDRYQTVYAEREASVAAPTAGLHFTPKLLDALTTSGVRLARLELEVGPGTFKPVEGEEITAHPMHPERYLIPEPLVEAVAETRARGGKLWAVGTTVVRALEAASEEAGMLRSGPGETRLMITPGYRFRVVDRLITNFHLPRSTLLMLVAAFAGMDTMRAAYAHAIRERYRFYSYGDAMVFLG